MEIILTNEELNAEKWAEFERYDKKYRISNMGRIMSYYRKVQHLMKPQLNSYGELMVMLTGRDRENMHGVLIGREVAKHFVDNPNNYRYIRFKDGNKLNCRASNIEWVQKTENMKRQYQARLKPVNVYDKEGRFLKSCNSAADAAKLFAISVSRVAQICRGEANEAAGYQFRYQEDVPAGQNIAAVAPKKEVPVFQYDREGNFIQEYASVKAAEEALQKAYAATNITNCAKGRRTTAYGYVWKYN